MTQTRYIKSAQSSGFRPVSVSGEGLSRMREESARVIQGMKEQRDAEISERNRQLAIQEENLSLEAGQRERDYQIQSQNLNNTLTGLQKEARAKQQQYEQSAQDFATILKGFSNISESAGEAYSKYILEKEKEQIEEDTEFYKQNQAAIDKRTIAAELGLDVADEAKNVRMDEAQAKGADPVAIANERNRSRRVLRETAKAKAAYFYENEFPGLLQESIINREKQLGRPMTSAELSAHMVDVDKFIRKKFREVGGLRLKPGSMRTAIKSADQTMQAVLSQRRQQELKNAKLFAVEEATKNLTQNPAEFSSTIVPSVMSVYRANDYDWAATHDWIASLATKRDAKTGEYRFTEEQLGSFVIQKGQGAYAQQWPNRFSEMMVQRQQDDLKYRSQQIQADNLAFREAEKDTLQFLVDNPTKDHADTAVSYFIDTHGRVPASILKYQENYTVEAKSKARQIEQLETIPDGFLLKEHVEALKRLDANSGRELEKRHADQEAKYNTGVFKDQSDSFKTVANGVTSFGSQKPNEPESVFLQQEMRAEYRKRVNQAVAGGADFNTAANTIAMQLAEEVKSGATDKNSLWYRKPSKPGGAANFPNLTGGNLTSVEKARRNYQAIVKSVADKGLEATLDTPESILTKDEITAIVSGYGKPGFVVPADVLAVTGMTNGLDPFTVINRQIKALGDPNVLPLEPPAIINSINNTMTEQQRQDLFNAVNGPKQRMRALHSSVGTTLNYRAGVPVASAVGATNPTPKEVYDYLRELGVSDIHAKGILANIQGESSFRVDALGDNGTSGGLFQMHNDRYRKMELSVPDWRTNWKGQVRHALRDDTAPQFLQMQFNSPEEAADWFLENYERPAMEYRAGRRELNRSFIPNLGF
jgi:hypothetical protein